MLSVGPSGPVRGEVLAPASKSMTNRLLVMAALAEGRSTLLSPLVSDDTVAMAEGLSALGTATALTSRAAVVEGRGGSVGPPAGVVDARLSGTTLRFLAAVSLLSPAPVTLDGSPALRRRPLGGLVAALERAGARVDTDGGHPPIVVASSAGLPGGHMVVDAAASSQFASALLLVAPYARSDVDLVAGNLGAAGYVEMTVEAMNRRGASAARRSPGRYSVTAGRHYMAGDESVEYDASAAAHLYALALASGGEVTVSNARPTLQPDGGITALFSEMGAEVSAGEAGGVTVAAGPGGLRAVSADLSSMPDQVATVAVLAALAPGVSRLSGLSVVRGHETDRLAAVAGELNKLGGRVEAGDDSLIVRGGRRLHPGTVETHEDHRMALAFSALATAVDGVRIAGPGCVAKTYPSWWEVLARLGVPVRPAEAQER